MRDMKRLILIALSAVIVLGFQQNKSGFSGTWLLDKAKSRDLPQMFTVIDSLKMKVVQFRDSLVATTMMKHSGQWTSFPLSVYRLDGKEQVVEDRAQGTRRSGKSALSDGGRKLTVDHRTEINLKGTKRRYIQKDVWIMKGTNELDVTMTQTFVDTDSTRTQYRVYKRIK
jgi:hypothetical protein